MPKDTQPEQLQRQPRFEQFEPRLVMSADPVGQIFADYFVEDAIDQQLESLEQELQLTLADAHEQTGLDDVRQDYGFAGAGQTVAVIDSGVAWDHYALGGGFGEDYRVVGGWDFTEGDADPYDDPLMGSHGTHVTGIIGADAGANSGVAPGVDLVSLRVFSDNGAGSFQWVEQALQWVHEHRNDYQNPITTVNLSLGTNWNSDTVPSWAMLEDEFAQLKADGIFISVAAGNSFTSYNTTGLSYPAVSDYVVPVASVDVDGQLSYYSQRDQGVIAAPGRSIVSTVPDYVGNQNKITDDWASYSGTSMAAPYVAGASVLVREAMELAGWSQITQDDIYGVMSDTADRIYDSITGQYYDRLNLQAAIDAVMPDDDFGSTAATAHGLGAMTDAMSLDGMIGRLDDIDYFTFTAQASGSFSASAATSHGMSPQWSLTGGVSNESGGVFSFDVAAGQSYTFSIRTGSTLGQYTLEMQFTANESAESFEFTDWGRIDSAGHTALQVNGETWCRIEASQAGLMTVESFFSHAQGNVDLELHDAWRNPLAVSYGAGDAERVDVQAAAGDVFYLKVAGANDAVDFRLTNLVSQSGTSVTVSDTDGADQFEFTAGASHLVSINGATYAFDSSEVSNVTFQGGAGDAAKLTGAAGRETATLRAGSTTLSGTGYQAEVTGVAQVVVDGQGGDDQAYFFDTQGDETFTAAPGEARMTGAGFDHRVVGFDRVYAYASAGNDVAHLHGGGSADTYQGWSDRSQMYGSGFLHDVRGFDEVHAYGEGGADRAYLYDTSGNETLIASPETTQMTGDGFNNIAHGFDRTYGYSTGGYDTAELHGSAQADISKAYTSYSTLYNNSFYVYARGFDLVQAYGEGGSDRAYFYDSRGSDRFEASPTSARLWGSGFDNRAAGFTRVYAYATKGDDRATYYDSGGADTFTATTSYARMVGAGYYNYGRGFDRNYAYSSAGSDKAQLYDSRANDRFQAWSDRARLYGTGFYSDVYGFASVRAYASRGSDRAYFYDSPSDDAYKATTSYARMVGVGFNNYASKFDRYYAYSTGGDDVANLYGSRGADRLIVQGTLSRLYGAGFYQYARGFRSVAAHAGGGADRAYLYDTAGDDTLSVKASHVAIESIDYASAAYGFDQVYAYARYGGVDHINTEAIDYYFRKYGAWKR